MRLVGYILVWFSSLNFIWGSIENHLDNDKGTNAERNIVVCYFTSWTVYRPGAGKFDVEDVDPFMCTHLMFAFAGINYDSTLKILDPYNELEENWGKGAMRRFTNLKKINPNLKTLLAIGGWNEGSEKFSRMAADPYLRRRFISSVVPFVKNYNFDGIDLDWEYPGSRGGDKHDKENHALLCAEIRAEFDKHGLLFTSAVPAGEDTAELGYDIPSISRSLDFLILMTYDFHGAWESLTGHHAPMFRLKKETGNQTKWNIKHAVEYWLEGGAPREKLILGLPTYGRGFRLEDPTDNGFYAPASQPIPAAAYTRQPGIWGYNEILESGVPRSWTVVRSECAVSPYAHNNFLWIGYDDEQSIGEKTKWAKYMRLGGVMFWSLDTDDFKGLNSEKAYPLIKTSVEVLNNEDVWKPPVAKPPPEIKPPVGSKPPPEIIPPVGSNPPVNPNPDNICKVDGLVKDPEDCRGFYSCQKIEDSWIIDHFYCPPRTIFNPVKQVCDWPSKVEGSDGCFL